MQLCALNALLVLIALFAGVGTVFAQSDNLAAASGRHIVARDAESLIVAVPDGVLVISVKRGVGKS